MKPVRTRRWAATAALILLTGSVLAQAPATPGSLGMVVANHPLGVLAGMRVLAGGGNAVDAAVATAAALGAAEPYLSGLGGDGFMLVYWADDAEVYSLEFAGVAPVKAKPDLFKDGVVNFNGPLSIAVPGAAAGWAAALDRFGGLPLDRVLGPAIEIAERGFPASAYAADAMTWAAGPFFEWEEIGVRAWWDGDPVPPGVGDTIRNPMLAETYRTLARDGLRTFYTGPVADELVTFVQRHGGVLEQSDLAAYEANWQEPLRLEYRGNTLVTPSDQSTGGLATLQTLNVLEEFDTPAWDALGAERSHVLIEAVKLAAEDRTRYGGDPNGQAGPIPYGKLLSDEYAAQQSARIDLGRAADAPNAGVEQAGTSHIVVIDRFHNVVSMTVSLGSGWGSGMVAGTTGVVMNNSLTLFSLDHESATALAPGKRVAWNMTPMLVLDDRGAWLAIGTPGGTSIWQTMPQVVSLILDQGWTIEEAIQAPRFRWALSNTSVTFESRVPQETIDALAAMGHPVRTYADWSIEVGAVAAAMIDRDSGAFVGSADPRREGLVIGW